MLIYIVHAMDLSNLQLRANHFFCILFASLDKLERSKWPRYCLFWLSWGILGEQNGFQLRFCSIMSGGKNLAPDPPKKWSLPTSLCVRVHVCVCVTLPYIQFRTLSVTTITCVMGTSSCIQTHFPSQGTPYCYHLIWSSWLLLLNFLHPFEFSLALGVV